MKIKTVIFDFDQVLCRDYFFKNLKASDPETSGLIDNFFKTQRPIIRDWMRGKFDYKHFNSLLKQKYGITADLDTLLLDSLKLMEFDSLLLNFTKELKSKGIIPALVTDNMDVFSIIKSHNRLEDYFDLIILSSDYGRLKADDDSLLDVAQEKLSLAYPEMLLVDDREDNGEKMIEKGGQFWHYQYNTEEFIDWFKKEVI